MFLYKYLFFSISSILSIPIMLIGINGGFFPAIFRVCFFILITLTPHVFTGLKSDIHIVEVSNSSIAQKCWSRDSEIAELVSNKGK